MDCKKYEYRTESVPENSQVTLLSLINAAGQEGWQVISFSVSDGGFESALMEKEVVINRRN